MREECKHFQSRTYASGEVARFCVLDLAPEAPWRCPDACPRYERRLADAGWSHGTLVEPALEEEPDVAGGDVASLLDEAENIVNAVVPQTRKEVAHEQDVRSGSGLFDRLRRGVRRRGNGGPSSGRDGS